MSWLGNQWADMFAKLGAQSIMVRPQIIKNTQQRLKEAVEEAKYIAWASVHILRSKLWGEHDENCKVIKVAPPVRHQALPAVGFIAHVYAQRQVAGFIV